MKNINYNSDSGKTHLLNAIIEPNVTSSLKIQEKDELFKQFHKNLSQGILLEKQKMFVEIPCEMHFEPLYYFVNLSSLRGYKWYVDYLMNSFSCDICDIYSYPQSLEHYSSTLQLYDVLPYTLMNVRIPVIYFVNQFSFLKSNQVWARMRDIAKDLVLDSHGNLAYLKDII